MKKTIESLKWSLICLIMAVGFFSCEDDDSIPNKEPVVPATNGVLILNQGGNNANNSGLTYYNAETEEFDVDVFNGTLGDLAQDMIIYGSKLYITLCNSSNITVVDVNDLSITKRIELFTEGKPQMPRYLASYGGKIYASCYDGNVVRLDTTSLQIDGTASAGGKLEGIAAYNGKLYVANSRPLDSDYIFYDTMTIIDIATFKKEKDLKVGLNPNIVQVDNKGNIFLSYKGNYNDIASGFQQINKTHEVATLTNSPIEGFTIVDNQIYFHDLIHDAEWNPICSVGTYDIEKKEFRPQTSIITDETEINTVYGMGVKPDTKDLYIANMTDYINPGKVFIFNPEGEKIKEINAGMFPCKILFYTNQLQ